MSTFAEITQNGHKLLINTALVQAVGEGENGTVSVQMQSGYWYFPSESFDEVKLRLGMPISPRAETLARGVV